MAELILQPATVGTHLANLKVFCAYAAQMSDEPSARVITAVAAVGVLFAVVCTREVGNVYKQQITKIQKQWKME